MIFKIQIALASSVESPPALIYNKDRSIFEHIPVDQDLLDLMAGRPKAFFECDLGVDRELRIRREVPDPGW